MIKAAIKPFRKRNKRPYPDIVGEGATRGIALASAVNKAIDQGYSLDGMDLSGLDRRFVRHKNDRVLIGAHLEGAQWTDDLVLERNPLIISIPNYWNVFVLYTSKGTYLHIGCEVHLAEDWKRWYTSDERPISSKVNDLEAANMRAFFERYGPWLFAACDL